MDVMNTRFPESFYHYQAELHGVGTLTSFLKWTVTLKGRRINDPLSDVAASLILYLNSPIRIEAGDAKRYIDRITDGPLAKTRLPGLGG